MIRLKLHEEGMIKADGVLIRGQSLDTQRDTHHMSTQRKDWSWTSEIQGETSEETNPASALLILDFQIPELWGNNMSF